VKGTQHLVYVNNDYLLDENTNNANKSQAFCWKLVMRSKVTAAVSGPN
jgi:hypothetical protein